MSIILKHLLRNMSAKKGRSIMILFSLGMAAFIATMLLSLGDGLDDLMDGMMKNILGDAQITASPMNPVRSSEVVLPDEVQTSFRCTYSVTRDFHQPSSFKYVTQRQVLLTGVNTDEACDLGYLTKAYEIADQCMIINKKAADELHYEIGDEVNLYDYNQEPVTLTISDIVENDGVLMKSSPSMVANLKTVSRLCGPYDDLCNGIFIRTENKKVDLEDLAKTIEEANKPLFITATTIDVHGAMKNISQMLVMGFVAFFAVLVIMIYFVISNISNTIIAERIPVIGTFRSIGATSQMMYLMLIGENAIYGLIAGILGALLGAKAFNAAMNAIEKFGNSMNMGVEGVTINFSTNVTTKPKVIIIVIIAAVVLQVLFSLWAIFSIRKISVKNLIFNKQDTRYVHSTKKLKLGFALLIGGIVFYIISLFFRKTTLMVLGGVSLVGLLAGMILIVPHFMRLMSVMFGRLADRLSSGVMTLAAANLKNNRMIIRTATLATATISLTLLMYNYTQASNEDIGYFPYHADFYIEDAAADWSSYSYIENIKGVQSAFPIYKASILKAMINDESTQMNVMANNNAEEIQKYTDYFPQMDWDLYQNLSADEALMDSELMKELKLHVGDQIVFQNAIIHDENLRPDPVTLYIKGEIDSSSVEKARNVMIVNQASYYRCNNGSAFDTILIMADDGKQQDVYDLLKVRTNIKTREDCIKEQERDGQQNKLIIGALIGMVILLSFISIFDNQMIGFIQRSRQFAVLYSTCTSKHQLKMTILCETALTFVGVLLFSLVGSLIMILPFERVLIGSGETMWVQPTVGMLGLLILVFIILMLTTRSPIKRLNKMKVVEEIKYE